MRIVRHQKSARAPVVVLLKQPAAPTVIVHRVRPVTQEVRVARAVKVPERVPAAWCVWLQAFVRQVARRLRSVEREKNARKAAVALLRVDAELLRTARRDNCVIRLENASTIAEPRGVMLARCVPPPEHVWLSRVTPECKVAVVSCFKPPKSIQIC